MAPKGRRAVRKAAKFSTSKSARDAGQTTDMAGDDEKRKPPPADNEATHESGALDSSKKEKAGTQEYFFNYSFITLRNTQESPLLKLPAEIRTYIWELAFGHRTVHPRALRGHFDWQPHLRTIKASKWGVSYDPCLESQSDHEIYTLSLRDPKEDRWHIHMHPGRGAPGFHNCDGKDTPRQLRYLVPPVCKQLWDEASECAWKTVTFAFVKSGDFQHFALFSGARLDQVRQLCIITPGFVLFEGRPTSQQHKFERGWERALTSGTMQQFTSLVGLNLVLRSFWGTSAWDTHTVEDLRYPPAECVYLPEIISTFQQLRLRPEHTTVLVTNAEYDNPYGFVHFTVPKRRKMARTIRDFILQETPDRDWSGRGRRMIIWPKNNGDIESQ